MKKRFIIVVDSIDQELENKITEYVKNNNFGWWHWIDSMWLLTSRNNDITCTIIRDEIGKITSNRLMVMEIKNNYNSWAGRGPSNEKKNMFTWLRNTWAKD